MIYTITFILSALVGLNFVLLKFSCNKTVKTRKFEKPALRVINFQPPCFLIDWLLVVVIAKESTKHNRHFTPSC